ncbi:MAG: LysM peptidoglycan-binding domain-containing protein, partial [Chitinophagales bacterium]
MAVSIYVVKPGDTLWAIARGQGVSLDALISANALPDPNQLVVGQALIVPSGTTTQRTYTVQPGDTLYAIARRFGTTISALVSANRLANPNLIYPGQILIIPGTTPTPGPEVTVNGYIFPISRTAAAGLLGAIGDLLTYLSVFSLPVDGRGGFLAIGDVAPVVTEARSRRIVPLITLSNFSPDAGTFTPDLAHAVLSDPDVRSATIENLVGYIRAAGFLGVNVDFENMDPADRALYNDFIRVLTDRMHTEGWLSTLAMAPKAADLPTLPWVGTFDYATLGSIV